MNYSKEELTEYDGKRGFWRTINGRKIFISIDDTKEETKEKIKAFVERKQSNNKVQENIDEANREYDKKRENVKNRYNQLKSRLKELESNNGDKEEINKVREEIDSLNLFHNLEEKEKSEPSINHDKKESIKPKHPIQEKKEEPKEDAIQRREVTDPYLKFGVEKDEEFLNARNFKSEQEREEFYKKEEIKHNIQYLKSRGVIIKDKKLYNERKEEYLSSQEAMEMISKARQSTKEILEKDKSDYARISGKVKSGAYGVELKEKVKSYYQKKGKKYGDESLINNSEYLADKYVKERMGKIKS